MHCPATAHRRNQARVRARANGPMRLCEDVRRALTVCPEKGRRFDSGGLPYYSSSLCTAGSGVTTCAFEWFEDSFFISGSIAMAMTVQARPAMPSLLNSAV